MFLLAVGSLLCSSRGQSCFEAVAVCCGDLHGMFCVPGVISMGFVERGSFSGRGAPATRVRNLLLGMDLLLPDAEALPLYCRKVTTCWMWSLWSRSTWNSMMRTICPCLTGSTIPSEHSRSLPFSLHVMIDRLIHGSISTLTSLSFVCRETNGLVSRIAVGGHVISSCSCDDCAVEDFVRVSEGLLSGLTCPRLRHRGGLERSVST